VGVGLRNRGNDGLQIATLAANSVSGGLGFGASMYSIIVRMNDADPQAWLDDVLIRIAEHPVRRLDELRSWYWPPLKARARQGSLTLPAISTVFTVTYVAEMLGENKDLLHELSIDMFSEDG
jgi:IS66 C-terminal element